MDTLPGGGGIILPTTGTKIRMCVIGVVAKNILEPMEQP